MVRFFNSTIGERLNAFFKPKRTDSSMLGEFSPVVQPVYDIGTSPRMRILSTTLASTTAGTTLLTSSSGKRTIIKGIYLQNQSDATADNTTIYIQTTIFTVGGAAAVVVARMQKLTTTAFNASQYFPLNLELARGGAMSFINTFTVGASTTSIIIYYEEEEL